MCQDVVRNEQSVIEHVNTNSVIYVDTVNIKILSTYHK